MKTTLLTTFLVITTSVTTTVLSATVWGAQAINPPRPAPVAEGVIGISIVVPPRELGTDQPQQDNEDPDQDRSAPPVVE